jgi:hypothetical protein
VEIHSASSGTSQKIKAPVNDQCSDKIKDRGRDKVARNESISSYRSLHYIHSQVNQCQNLYGLILRKVFSLAVVNPHGKMEYYQMSKAKVIYFANKLVWEYL